MIFGVGYPVIEIISTSEVIELKYGAIFPTYKDKRILENESPINGTRSWVDLWNHASFQVTVHLYNADDPVSYFNQLGVIEDALVYFSPHKYSDTSRLILSEYLKDTDAALAPFKCTQFEPYYLKNVNHYDCLDLTFKSSTPIMLSTQTVSELE